MPRITSTELQDKLGLVIEEAEVEPVIVTKQGRDHVVLLSAERYAELLSGTRRVRLTSTLSAEEIAAVQQAEVPDPGEQAHILAELAAFTATREKTAP